MRSLALLALLAGCHGTGHDTGAVPTYLDYVGRDGVQYDYTPSDDTGDQPLMLRIAPGSWNLRQGADWADGWTVGTFEVKVDGGLFVGGDQLLPAQVTEGASGEGVEITETGATTTWYGTFPDTLTVEVDSGRWRGTQVFARDLGPVVLTLDGTERALVYYQNAPSED